MLVVEPQRFAIVPEWVLDLDVSDAALRLYALLLRYGGTSGPGCRRGGCWPNGCDARSTRSTGPCATSKTAGLVRVEHRRRGRENLTNRYHVRTTNPADRRPPTAVC
jgi:hypothetical protein